MKNQPWQVQTVQSVAHGDNSCKRLPQKCLVQDQFIGAFRKIAKRDYDFRRVCLSAWNNSAPTGRIFMKFDI
jgi:hypothetical protein